jgi:hypothetical protein
MALATRDLDICKRGNHSGMGGRFFCSLVVAAVAYVTEIAEGMRLVPASSIVVDGLLKLRFVAVLA